MFNGHHGRHRWQLHAVLQLSACQDASAGSRISRLRAPHGHGFAYNITTREDYSQTFPHVSMPLSVLSTQAGGAKIQEIANTLNTKTQGSGTRRDTSHTSRRRRRQLRGRQFRSRGVAQRRVDHARDDDYRARRLRQPDVRDGRYAGQGRAFGAVQYDVLANHSHSVRQPRDDWCLGRPTLTTLTETWRVSVVRTPATLLSTSRCVALRGNVLSQGCRRSRSSPTTNTCQPVAAMSPRSPYRQHAARRCVGAASHAFRLWREVPIPGGDHRSGRAGDKDQLSLRSRAADLDQGSELVERAGRDCAQDLIHVRQLRPADSGDAHRRHLQGGCLFCVHREQQLLRQLRLPHACGHERTRCRWWVDQLDDGIFRLVRALSVGTMPLASGGSSYVALAYDSLGRLTTRSEPYRVRLPAIASTSTTSSGGRRTHVCVMQRTTSAGVEGCLRRPQASITNPRNNVTERISDVMGNLRQVVDPAPGGTTSYGYSYIASGVLETPSRMLRETRAGPAPISKASLRNRSIPIGARGSTTTTLWAS